jgi:hypothetical protein
VAVHKRPGLAFMEDGAGRRLQDQTRADSLDERLLGWVMNGEERRVQQAQAPAEKDLENRRDPVVKEGYVHYDLGILLEKSENGILLLRFVWE